MLIISEYELTEEEINKYHDRGYRVAYGNEQPVIYKGEAVGFLLDTLYKSTIDLIEKLLDGDNEYTIDNKTGVLNLNHKQKHNITLKYNDKTYNLSTLDEWKETTQHDKDMLKLETYKHPILKVYLEKRKEYFEQKALSKIQDKFKDLLEEYNVNEMPNETEVTTFLSTFAPLYQVDIAQDDLDRIKQYFQIQWYLDNDIPYVNEVKGINPNDELMFENVKFKTFYEEPIEIESFGNEIYLEDYVYKNTETLA